MNTTFPLFPYFIIAYCIILVATQPTFTFLPLLSDYNHYERTITYCSLASAAAKSLEANNCTSTGGGERGDTMNGGGGGGTTTLADVMAVANAMQYGGQTGGGQTMHQMEVNSEVSEGE